MGEHPGLARPGAGDDEQRALGRGRRPRAATGLSPSSRLVACAATRSPYRRPPTPHRTLSALDSAPGGSDRRPERRRRATGRTAAQPLTSPPVADGRTRGRREPGHRGRRVGGDDRLAPRRHRPGGLRTGPGHRRRPARRRHRLPRVRLAGGVPPGGRLASSGSSTPQGAIADGDARRRRASPPIAASEIAAGGVRRPTQPVAPARWPASTPSSTSRTMVRALWTASAIAARRPDDEAADRSRACWPTTAASWCCRPPSAARPRLRRCRRPVPA